MSSGHIPKYKHRICPCGCGELADECMSPGSALNAFSGWRLVHADDRPQTFAEHTADALALIHDHVEVPE
jgi:hypothetical protein